MKEHIGITAGAIWKILNEQDQVALSRLPKAVREKESVTYQALGWLARENKIEYKVEGKKTYVLLANREQH